jgi:hypothetical protein
MTMRVNKIVTYLRPEDAYTLVEFLDQLREALMETYGDDITAMLQEAMQHDASAGYGDDEVF